VSQCKHWSKCGIKGGGCCALGEFNGTPTHIACDKMCKKREEIDTNSPTQPVAKKKAVVPGDVDLKPLPMPPLLDQAKDLMKAATDVVKGVARGKRITASKKVERARMAVCETCDAFDKKRKRCSKCGCYMKAKTKLKESKCPLGKWEA